MNKCIRLQIQLNDDHIDIKKLYKELWDIQYKTRTACNFAMNLQYNELMRKQAEKLENVEFKKDKELYGKSFGAWIENRMNEYMDGCSSANVAQTRQFATNKANFNPIILKEIASFGFGADCVSGNEILRAIECGFDPSKIAFAGVGIDSTLKQKMLLSRPIFISLSVFPTPAKAILEGANPHSNALRISFPLTQSAPKP